VLIVTRLDRLARSTRDLLDVIAALTDFAAGALSETSRIAMPRAKKHPKLSADERAFHNRLDCLNEEEIKQLTTREIFAYFKIIDNVDSRRKMARSPSRAGGPAYTSSGHRNGQKLSPAAGHFFCRARQARFPALMSSADRRRAPTATNSLAGDL